MSTESGASLSILVPVSVGSSAMFIVAHPDDEVLGAGGTIARLTRSGHSVDVLVIGEGATSRESSDSQDVVVLRESLERSAEILGIRSVESLGLRDNRLDSYDLLTVVQSIEKVLLRRKPSVVFTHSQAEINVDHQIASRAALVATRPTPECVVESVLFFETRSSSEWSFGQIGSFMPNHFVELCDSDVELKCRALEAYETEIRSAPHPRSRSVLMSEAVVVGSVVGYDLAEAFQLVRSRFPLSDKD